MALMAVEDALARIVSGLTPVAGESVAIGEAPGRVLARAIKARRDQPPFDASAMDGYAVRAGDVAGPPVDLKVVGVSRAGAAWRGVLKTGEAVRIFTGAPLPAGADAIVIQENTRRHGERVRVLQAAQAGRFVRRRGLDFERGDVLLHTGRRLDARAMALIAAANHARVRVRRRPTVAFISTGDELVAPGERPGRDEIIASNGAALAAFVSSRGGKPIDLGIQPDRLDAIVAAIEAGRDADVLVTIGGASVGEHDLVREALRQAGARLSFWRIAMRPGKPVMFARRGRQRILGLPGNPVSALVTARIFLQPLIEALLGLCPPRRSTTAVLAEAMSANDERQDYIRARFVGEEGGRARVAPFSRQDSSMQRVLAEADALIVRPPHAPAVGPGDEVTILPLDF